MGSSWEHLHPLQSSTHLWNVTFQNGILTNDKSMNVSWRRSDHFLIWLDMALEVGIHHLYKGMVKGFQWREVSKLQEWMVPILWLHSEVKRNHVGWVSRGPEPKNAKREVKILTTPASPDGPGWPGLPGGPWREEEKMQEDVRHIDKPW